MDVLIVHGNAIQRSLHRTALRACEPTWTIRTAASKAGALTACERALPDCVVVSHMLPDATGLELFARLNGRFGRSSFAIVFVTRYGQEDAGVRALELGAQDAVHEPALDPMRALAVRVRRAVTRAGLERALREARESLGYRSHVFAMAVHDLRAPLMVVRGSLDELDADRRELPQLLPILRRSTDRLVTLTEELADVAAIDQGALRLDRRPTDLSAVARQVVDELAHTGAATKRTIRLQSGGSQEAYVDGERISRVLTNLVSNALRHATHDVHVRVDGDDERVEITVEDDGTGIDPDVLPHLFDRFERGRRPLGRGLGLGLAIVRELVRAHGGQVRVQPRGSGSSAPRGASFVIDLPRHAPAAH